MCACMCSSAALPRPSRPRYMCAPLAYVRACDHVVVCGEGERTPQGERSGKEGSGVPRGQKKEAGGERERSRVRRSAESPGARERRLERDFRHLPFIHLSLPRIYHGYFGTLAAHNTCTQRSLVPGPIPRRPPPIGSKVLPVEEGS